MATTDDRIAVLIDADNTSPRYAEALLDEIAKYGNPTIKRAYGDFSSSHLGGWTRQLNALAIRAMHQHAFTKGKNSTDLGLLIDAMDLLHTGNVHAFALVSSDSDFTSLALRLREAGKVVYGVGEKKTPPSLKNAVDKFIQLELLGADLSSEDSAPEDPEQPQGINLQSALTRAINKTSDEDGWTGLSALGQHLRRTHASFDTREWDFPNLSSLVMAQPYLETSGTGNETRIRLKGKQSAKQPVKKAASARKATKKV